MYTGIYNVCLLCSATPPPLAAADVTYALQDPSLPEPVPTALPQLVSSDSFHACICMCVCVCVCAGSFTPRTCANCSAPVSK